MLSYHTLAQAKCTSHSHHHPNSRHHQYYCEEDQSRQNGIQDFLNAYCSSCVWRPGLELNQHAPRVPSRVSNFPPPGRSTEGASWALRRKWIRGKRVNLRDCNWAGQQQQTSASTCAACLESMVSATSGRMSLYYFCDARFTFGEFWDCVRGDSASAVIRPDRAASA